METVDNMKQPEDFKSDSNEKTGMGIGIITRGWTSIKWMMHMEHIRGSFPVGMFWKYLIVEGRGWADARTEIVHKARAFNFKYIMFIDDDVFIPTDAINRLVQTGKKIISGVYWTKTDPPRPVIFNKMGEGPYDSFELDSIIEIAGSGLGCCLIDMDVFDKFDEANIPYFLENWIHTDKSGSKMKCPVGEDHYFFTKAKELGFKVYADTGCLCDHYDYKTKRFFPGETFVREMSERKLKQIGRKDLIDKNKTHLGVDSNKRTICFFNATANPFAGDELEKRGLGGSESCIINLSHVFANKYGFNVHVFCNCNEPGIYNNVVYHNIKTAKDEDISILNIDLLILTRNVSVLDKTDFSKLNVKKTCLWAHDLATDPIWQGISKHLHKIDKICALTNWHKENIIKEHNIRSDKFFIARNGVDLLRFKAQDIAQGISRIPGKCIYSSTPFRGLDILLEVWPRILKEVPHAKLHIFSSMKIYGTAYNDAAFEALYQQARAMDGVEYYGAIKQDKLAKHYLESELLTYPNTFDETSCITVLESQTAGTPIVTSARAALTETVPDDVGIKISLEPYSDEYKDLFVKSCIGILKGKNKWEELHSACLRYDYSWETIAEEWLHEFFPGVKEESILGDNLPGITDKQKKSDEIKQQIETELGVEMNSPQYWDIVYDKDIKQQVDRGDRIRYELLCKLIKPGDRVLDIGCGLGEFTRHVRARFPNNEIWGTDVSHKALDYCRELDRSIYYANHPVENTENFEKGYFDIITAQHLIEHLKSPEEIILKMRKIVKMHGKLILVIPIDDEPWHEHLRIWSMHDVYKLVADYLKDDEVSVSLRENPNRRYKGGRPFEEAIIIAKKIQRYGK